MGAQPTVIIIDSDPDGRATTAALLADAPVDLIASAEYGHQASAQVAVVQPHIVLAAIAEPLDDAIATLKAIAQQCPHTSIVAYSQLVGPSVLRHVAQLGVADLLPQPLDPADLKAAIERIPFQPPVQKTGRVITVFGA